jgi:predicted RNA-binding Zn-ribbon protein involved in translation (DUF1610 family)
MSDLIPCSEHLEPSTPCRCDNCGWTVDLSMLNRIADASQRLHPGEEIPAGECPECGALSYLANPPEWTLAGRLAREALAPETLSQFVDRVNPSPGEWGVKQEILPLEIKPRANAPWYVTRSADSRYPLGPRETCKEWDASGNLQFRLFETEGAAQAHADILNLSDQA